MSHDLMWPGMTLGAALIVLLAAHIRQINGRLRQQVAGRKRADDLLADLQAEKALILKEVHHRIKGHMTTVYSLLSLQAGTLQDSAATVVLEDAGNRVRGMMLLYDKLYQTGGFERLSITDYLPALVAEIIVNFHHHPAVEIETSIADVVLDVKRLQALGIIINELLNNSLKHGFPGRPDGAITVEVSQQDQQVCLVLRDNGVGIPAELTAQTSTGFGLMLVGILVVQLKGQWRMERDNGTRTTVHFPV